MKDYSYLEGKIIDWVERSGVVFKAQVAMIEYEIGLTLVIAQDYRHVVDGELAMELKKDITEVTCLNGPSSPNETTLGYDDVFKYAIQAIKEGTYRANDAEAVAGQYSILYRHGTMAACAFK